MSNGNFEFDVIPQASLQDNYRHTGIPGLWTQELDAGL